MGPASGGHRGTPRLPARQGLETSHRLPAFIEYTWERLWSLNSNLYHCIKEHSHALQLLKEMNVLSTFYLLKKPIQNFPKRPICVPNVSTHFFKVEAWVSQSCPTLCNLMDCSPPGSSVLEFSRQEYWSGFPFPSPGDLPHLGIESGSLALKADSLPSEPPGKPTHFFRYSLRIWLYYLE